MSQTTVGMKEAPREHRSLEEVRTRILTYEQDIKQYLEHLNANVEYYKFSVEKHGDGVSVEVSVKATIRERPAQAAKA